MEAILVFFTTYGWQLAIIALMSVVLLGVLKYCNVFANLKPETRKPIYFAISMGLSIVGTAIYLVVIHQFQIDYFFAITMATYALNQTMYAIYETTHLRELVVKVLDFIKELITKRQTKQ